MEFDRKVKAGACAVIRRAPGEPERVIPLQANIPGECAATAPEEEKACA